MVLVAPVSPRKLGFSGCPLFLVFLLHLVASGCIDSNETCPGGGCTGGTLLSGAPNFYVGTQEESYFGEQWQNLTERVLEIINLEDIRSFSPVFSRFPYALLPQT